MTSDCREIIDELNKELDQILYAISHDLRAPLRAIDGFSLAVVEDYGDKLDETGQDYLERVRKGGRILNEYIDGLLLISRQSRGEIVPEEVNLSDLAREIGASMEKKYTGRTVEFVIEADVVAAVDRRLARILFQQILDNCWKYTTGKPDAKVEFGVTDIDGVTAYFFSDNGAGFDMRYAGDRLFGPFQRMHPEEEFEGLGVGLATAKRIINRHKGKIWAESEIGKGTTIFFSL
jgi:light-regulated signal transduction histidine kinase (bacteriophytochrome)